MVTWVLLLVLSVLGLITSWAMYCVKRQYEESPRKQLLIIVVALVVIVGLLATFTIQETSVVNGAEFLTSVTPENPVMSDYGLYHDSSNNTYFIVDCNVFDISHIFHRVYVDANVAESYIESANQINLNLSD